MSALASAVKVRYVGLMSISEMGAMRVAKPKEWERRVRYVMRWFRDMETGANHLGVSTRTLRRWARELGYVDGREKRDGRPLRIGQ